MPEKTTTEGAGVNKAAEMAGAVPAMAPAVAAAKTPVKRTMTYNQPTSCPDMEAEFWPIYEAARPLTMTSLERMYGLYKAVEYVVREAVAGDVIECGVWKGGSAVVAAMTLLRLGDTSRKLWLYDTYTSMPAPGADDVQYDDVSADERLAGQGMASWDEVKVAPVEAVRAAVLATGYPAGQVELVQGMVEETIPAVGPGRVAVLRLDTDWYASTKHELVHLYPRLSGGGVLLIDDYGHWKGSRKAVDEYFAEHGVKMLLSRLDYTGRMGVKPAVG